MFPIKVVVFNKISRMMRRVGYVARMGEIRNAYTHGRDKKSIQYFGCKSCGKRPLGRHRRRWEDNIRMDLREIGLDWIHLDQDRDHERAVVNTVMNLSVP
jgi:hypothetical protein